MSGVKNDEMFGLKSYSTTGPSILYNQEGEDGLKGPFTLCKMHVRMYESFSFDGHRRIPDTVSWCRWNGVLKENFPRATFRSEDDPNKPAASASQGGRMKHEALTAHGNSQPTHSRIPRARLIGLEGDEDVPTIQLGKFPGVELPQGVTDTSA
ncbi:hypothetical protein CIHG_03936 [Coccidioides immitis H538.4]|uniref:Uncharacterized protein n=2 Tax=Coccidioides immitis TaxID=5501 RepID=A0A0J8UFK0_COCIT|nr:hypothetical protein CIRG_03688 [Coccidioides immitis RMSCC 2394]KMU86148.1 hypothetical protein CIHG_03936 [Coccidioides immitis H538.4]